MKKLQLNKKVIAQLNNPENILGGVPVTCGTACGMEGREWNVGLVSKIFDAKGGAVCATGDATMCMTSNGCP